RGSPSPWRAASARPPGASPTSVARGHRRRAWLAVGSPWRWFAIYEQLSRARKTHAVLAAATSTGLRGQLHSRLSLFLARALVCVSRASLVAVGLAGALGASDLFQTPVLVPILLAFSVLPAAAAWLVEHAAGARAAVRDDALVLCRPDLRVEVARTEIARVVPWKLPLPGPGVSFSLRSGRRLRHGFEVAGPLSLPALVVGPGGA